MMEEKHLEKLKEQKKHLTASLAEVRFALNALDQRNVSVVVKRIRGNVYYYEEWREEGRLHYRSLGRVAPGRTAEIERVNMRKKDLREELAALTFLLKETDRSIRACEKYCASQSILSDYSFEVYWKNELTARVYAAGNRVHITRLVKHPLKQLFSSSCLSRDQLNHVLALRCYDPHRADLPQLLQALNIDGNRPYDFVRKTHGVTYNDFIWFRFPGEDLSAEDVLIRKAHDVSDCA